MNNLYILANSNKVMKIKDNKQLIDLSFNVEFLTTKFDELEKERKKNDELISSLQIGVSSLKTEVKKSRKQSR